MKESIALHLASLGDAYILPAAVARERDPSAQGGANSPSEPLRPSGSAGGPTAYLKADAARTFSLIHYFRLGECREKIPLLLAFPFLGFLPRGGYETSNRDAQYATSDL